MIDAKRVSCDLVIQARGVRITRSATSRIEADDSARASVTIEDSEVDARRWQGAAIGFQNVTVRRTEVRGGQTSVLCGRHCVIEDSWLHGQYLNPHRSQHVGGYLSNGGGDVTLRHNSISCDPPDNAVGGGCTGSAQIFGDFARNAGYLFERNLFRATPGGYCASFGDNPGKPFPKTSRIVVKGNVFQRGKSGKCGVWGAATSFDASGPGNVWSRNSWDDGRPLAP